MGIKKVSGRNTGLGRPLGSKTVNTGTARFKSALESGFDVALVRAMAAALNRMGDDPKLRFLTLSKGISDPPTRSEERLPVALMTEARRQAAALSVFAIHVPRSIKREIVLTDEEGIRWMLKHGVSQRTMADVFGVSTVTLFSAFGRVKPGPRVTQIRRVREDTEAAYRAGLAWLGSGNPTGKAEAVLCERFGPARIARCGGALLAFRKALQRDPVRADR